MLNPMLPTTEGVYYRHAQLAELFNQACQYHITNPKTAIGFYQALRALATIGNMACERATYAQPLCQRLYSQLIYWDFKPTSDNLNEFSEALATFTCIALENLWLSNYEIPHNPYYCAPFFKALKNSLYTPATNEATQLLEILYRHIDLNEGYPETTAEAAENTRPHHSQAA